MSPMDTDDIRDLWDQFHPSEAADDEEDFSDIPMLPTIDRLPPAVDYSDRAPGDFVVSGPLLGGEGPGRRFDSALKAFQDAALKYGQARVSPIDAGPFRWAVLVRGVK